MQKKAYLHSLPIFCLLQSRAFMTYLNFFFNASAFLLRSSWPFLAAAIFCLYSCMFLHYILLTFCWQLFDSWPITRILIIMQLRQSGKHVWIWLQYLRLKIQLMNNYVKYSRGGMLLDLENQRNHYRLLVQPRKSMRISQQYNNKLNLSLNQNSKYQKQLKKSVEYENERLYKALENIKSGKGVIQLMSEKAKQDGKNRKKATLVNQFKLLEKKKQLRKGNQRIVGKITKVKPIIGSAVQWDEHYENYEKQIKKISRATQNVFDMNKHDELRSLFRQTIDFHRSRTCKESAKRSTTRSVSKRKNSQKVNKKMNEQNLDDLTMQQINLIDRQQEVCSKHEKNQKLPKIQKSAQAPENNNFTAKQKEQGQENGRTTQ